MKRLITSIITSALFTTSPCFANKVTAVDNKPDSPQVDQEIILTFKFSVPDEAIRCGVQIDWGDGESSKYRVGPDQDIKPPYQVTHTYRSAGKMQVAVKGVTIFRGLNTVTGCDANLQGPITVIDPVEAERLTQLKAAQDAKRLADLEAEKIKQAKEAEEAKKLEAYKKTPAYQKEQALLEKKRIQEESIAKKAAEAEAKQKLANMQEFVFIKPDSPKNTIDEVTFLKVCEKTNYWKRGEYGSSNSNGIVSTIVKYGIFDGRAAALIEDGGADIKLLNISVNKVSNKCMLSFSVTGVYKGSSVNLTAACKVTQINKMSNNEFIATEFFAYGDCYKIN